MLSRSDSSATNNFQWLKEIRSGLEYIVQLIIDLYGVVTSE